MRVTRTSRGMCQRCENNVSRHIVMAKVYHMYVPSRDRYVEYKHERAPEPAATLTIPLLTLNSGKPQLARTGSPPWGSWLLSSILPTSIHFYTSSKSSTIEHHVGLSQTHQYGHATPCSTCTQRVQWDRVQMANDHIQTCILQV